MKTVDEIKTVAGIGGGVIGGSWAVLFAMKGYDVNLYDINDECIANDKKTIEGNLSFLVENGAIADAASVEARIHCTTSMEEAVKNAQFIQESGPERLPIKQSMLASIEEFAPVDAIIATSSSTTALWTASSASFPQAKGPCFFTRTAGRAAGSSSRKRSTTTRPVSSS